jgi:hypothetical protein
VATREVRNEVEVRAPPAEVWRVLTDTAAYREWNPRLVRVDGELRAGGVVTLHYLQDRAWMPKRFVVDVDACDPERELRWSGPRSPARALLRASHFFELSAQGEGTRVLHAERFEGRLVRAVWPLLRPAVEAGHAAVNDALRARCEG